MQGRSDTLIYALAVRLLLNGRGTMTNKDYIYCEDCKMLVDFWKYEHNAVDAGHGGCNWRYVTDEELKECIEDCEKSGCFAE